MGTYALLDTSTPRLLGLPALVLGVALSTAGFVIGGRRVRRTQYRPDPWRFAEWSTSFTGFVAAAVVITVGRLDASALNPSIYPLAWPTLPALPAAAILFAVLPAFLTPPPPVAASSPARAEPAVAVRQPVGANA
jgi:energy-coupling factor transport system permease protein